MLKRKRMIPFVLLGVAMIAVVVLSEATLEAPEAYADGFCLLEQGNQICDFSTLAKCMEKMQSTDSECVRVTLKDKATKQRASIKPQ